MGANFGFPPNLFGSAPVTGQAKVAVTGTAVQLADHPLLNGVIITNNGTTTITLGDSSVTNTATGAGNGYVLGAGASVSAATDNTSRIYINGTATTSWVSFIGS